MGYKYLYISWDFLREINPIPIPSHADDPNSEAYLLDEEDADKIERDIKNFYESLHKLKMFFAYFDHNQKNNDLV